MKQCAYVCFREWHQVCVSVCVRLAVNALGPRLLSLSLYQCIFAVSSGAWKAFRTLAHRGRDPVSNTHTHTHAHTHTLSYLSYRVITGL